MILIDSLYINGSGGLLLLKYLVHEVYVSGKAFHLLADTRCQGEFNGISITYLTANHKNRKAFYISHKQDYSSILCFGNIPPPIKLGVPVYTYFHNINLLTLKDIYFFKWKLEAYLKRWYFRWYKKNTDFWIVQTSNTKTELIKHLREKDKRVKIIPFFDIPESIKEKKYTSHGNDYAYIGSFTGSKGHDELLTAWEMLHDKGINETLHLTVREGAPIFPKRIKQAQERGIQVVNHGQVPYSEVGSIYAKAKAIIYPSLNESLGLGIIEAINSGCDVIGSDLPFIHSICIPSVVFNPRDPESIVQAVIRYEMGEKTDSVLTISNDIEVLLELFV